MFNQTDALLTLSYLMGERTVPTTGVASRQDFIQTTLTEAYAAYNWRFSTAIATISVTGQVASLASNFDVNHIVSVFDITNGVTELEQIDPEDSVYARDGDGKYWLISPNNDGYYTVNTSDTSVSTIKTVYETTAPLINATITTPYPNKQTIALGARRWVKMAQNPDADISQDEQLFQDHLSADIAAMQTAAPRKKRVSAQSRRGYRTGDF